MFVGREWLFERIETWLKKGPGMCLLVGEPGIGKSAFLRELARRRKDVVSVDLRQPLGTHDATGFWQALLSQLDLEGKKVPGTAVEAARWAEEMLPLKGKKSRLVLLDSFDAAAGVWDGHGLPGLERLEGVKILIACRPGSHVNALQRAGAAIVRLDSRRPENLSDLDAFVRSVVESRNLGAELVELAKAESFGNFLVAEGLLRGMASGELSVHQVDDNPVRLHHMLWGLWEEVVARVPREEVRELSRVACALAEAGEPLDSDSISDFLGMSAVRVRQLISVLEPLLRERHDRYSLFNPKMSLTIARYLQRDLVTVHGDVVTFFRETFPSWEEMDDRYGWFYLAHHCDRFARTSRRRDFSVLHWLGEGPFIKAKLRHTGSLSSVLQDLMRCLRAALEQGDLPRTVSYGLTIPRLRADEAARSTHLQADLGNFHSARENAELIVGEGSRFLAFLLLAWQALEEEKPALMHDFLDLALAVPVPALKDVDMPLFLRMAGDFLLRADTRSKALRLLDLEEDPYRAAISCLGLGRSERLGEEIRREVIELGISITSRFEEEGVRESRLGEFARLLEDLGEAKRAKKLATPKALKQQFDPNLLVKAEDPKAKFQEAMKLCASKRWDPVRATGYVGLCEALRRLGPEDWVIQSFMEIMAAGEEIKLARERLRVWLAVTDGLARLGTRAGAVELFEKLASLAGNLEEASLQARLLADVGAALYRIREFRASSRRFSEAAELAFGLEDRSERGDTLSFVAGQVARAGHSLRARDLAWHALETREQPMPFPVDQNCRATLKLAVASILSDQKSVEMFQMGAEAVSQADEYGPELKAATLATLAGGISRLGDSAWSRKLLDQAIGAARAMDPGAAKTVTLSSLAAQESAGGDVGKAEQLLKEAVEALGAETDPGGKAEGYVAVATAFEGMALRKQARAHLGQALKQLENVPATTLASSRALLCTASLAEHQDLRDRVRDLVRKAEASLDEVSASQRDDDRLALLEIHAALGDFDEARAYLPQFDSTTVRSKALAKLARVIIRQEPEEAIAYLRAIPLVSVRMEAIRRCTIEVNSELRPSMQVEMRRTLVQLTLLSMDDQTTADMIVSRWVFFDPRPTSLNQTAVKMGWLVEDEEAAAARRSSAFRELELTSTT